jgi:hypothetical protein
VYAVTRRWVLGGICAVALFALRPRKILAEDENGSEGGQSNDPDMHSLTRANAGGASKSDSGPSQSPLGERHFVDSGDPLSRAVGSYNYLRGVSEKEIKAASPRKESGDFFDEARAHNHDMLGLRERDVVERVERLEQIAQALKKPQELIEDGRIEALGIPLLAQKLLHADKSGDEASQMFSYDPALLGGAAITGGVVGVIGVGSAVVLGPPSVAGLALGTAAIAVAVGETLEAAVTVAKAELYFESELDSQSVFDETRGTLPAAAAAAYDLAIDELNDTLHIEDIEVIEKIGDRMPSTPATLDPISGWKNAGLPPF